MESQKLSKPNDRRDKPPSENKKTNCIEMVGIILSFFLLIVFFPIAIFFCVVIVPEYQRIVVFRCGRLRKRGVRGPGVVFVLPCVDDVTRVDLRTSSFDVPAQDVLTKDSVDVKVDAVVYYHIKDPTKAVLQVKDARVATEYLAQTKLRTIVATKLLSQLLSSREGLVKEIFYSLSDATEAWGVMVERVEIKDIKLSPSTHKALAQEAEAQRGANAKLASAESEKEASKSLKAASDIMKESPYTLQLRYMETLNVITKNKDTTIIFPVPVDILPPGTLDCKN